MSSPIVPSSTLDINEEDLHNFKESYFKPMFNHISRIHIDMECLRDYDLGIVLSMISTEVEYEYILSKLEEYNNSLDKDVLYHFNELGYTREQLNTFQADPKNQLPMVIAAPPTNLYFEVMEMIKYVNHQNQKMTTIEHAEVWFNFARFKYPDRAKLLVLSDIYQGAMPFPAEFTNFNYTDLPNDHIRQTDVWVVKDVLAFLNSPGVVHALTNSISFSHKHVLSPRIYSRALITKIENINQHLNNQLADINLLMNFAYMPYRILTKGDYTDGETPDQSAT